MNNFKFLNANEYSSLVLAYVGDSVFELYVRSHIVGKANMPVNKLHKASSQLVKAKAQSEMAEKLLPLLSEQELEIFKRGRNAHSYTSPKNADIVDYRRATGLEALIGYLFITHNNERLDEIIKICLE